MPYVWTGQGKVVKAAMVELEREKIFDNLELLSFKNDLAELQRLLKS